jgi:hypothetical protein
LNMRNMINVKMLRLDSYKVNDWKINLNNDKLCIN